jgi:hypothetical protein
MGKKNDKTTTIEEVVVVPNKSPKADVLNNNKDAFPQSWFGNWEGTLEIYNAKGLAQTIPMELVMAATDTVGVYKWYIIYGTDREKGLRPYLLRTIDASKGHYQCDELNSIKMDSYLLGNKLFCNFIVEGNLLISVYEKDGENMKFEIIFGKEKPVSETGGEIVKGDTIPKVRTLPVLINQKAVLKKKT